MTPEEIIEMARQAGLEVVIQQSSDGLSKTVRMPPMKPLEAFAKLVAAKEREACAKVCDDKQYVHPYHDLGTLIRARGEA
jgi:hypothetical protein